MNLNKLFLSYCKINNLEINPSQLGSNRRIEFILYSKL